MTTAPTTRNGLRLSVPDQVVTPMAQRIEHWPIARLVPYAKNARTHSDEQVMQIAASIAQFGFTNPILVDTNAGILAGHGRLLAAQKLLLSEVPVIVLDHLTETQRRAYIIADNRLALNAGWNEEVLSAELAQLEREGLDLELIGFTDSELEEMLRDEHAARPTRTPYRLRPTRRPRSRGICGCSAITGSCAATRRRKRTWTGCWPAPDPPGQHRPAVQREGRAALQQRDRRRALLVSNRDRRITRGSTWLGEAKGRRTHGEAARRRTGRCRTTSCPTRRSI